MYAERLMLETDRAGKIKQMPKLPPNKQLEAIFLVISDNLALPEIRRTPHPDIVGKISIMGDLFDSVPASLWNLPR